MESITIFYQAISQLCNGRVYPDHIPVQNSAGNAGQWPAIRYIQVGGQVDNTNCYSEYRPRIQVDIYANSVAERAQVVQQVQQALADEALDIECVPHRAPMHAYDIEREKYQAILDYTLL